MIYLSRFNFPDPGQEEFFLDDNNVLTTEFYPFRFFSSRDLFSVSFEPVTIFYGGNGSGKTTALNIIAEHIGLSRSASYNHGDFFTEYVKLCSYSTENKITSNSSVITSDDIFDYMLNLRSMNQSVDGKRRDIAREYLNLKQSKVRLRSMADYEEFSRYYETRTTPRYKYIDRRLMDNIRTQSNGESALYYFSNKIRENALYLLDEPENSLSPENQIKLVCFLEDSARFFNCQFVIATHSPFLLSMKGAKIYDLDSTPVVPRRWTELQNVRAYFDFFQEHASEFGE